MTRYAVETRAPDSRRYVLVYRNLAGEWVRQGARYRYLERAEARAAKIGGRVIDLGFVRFVQHAEAVREIPSDLLRAELRRRDREGGLDTLSR
jgi:hypothetical protein